MSQQMRRALAAVGLTAALLLSFPAPSRAAGFQTPASAAGLVERIWTWLWSLGAASSAPQGSMPVMTQKDAPVNPPPAGPPGPSNDQGSMIDPDGK